jgi:L-idonate 5-dehydrogenase
MSDHANHAVVIHGAGDVRVEERAEPLPGEGQVQVTVELGGICGSDISYYRHGAVGDFRVLRPMVLGHEVIGTVSKIGGGVDGEHEGRRVAVDPSSPCGRCDRCLEGRSNVCLFPTFLGSASTDPHVDGGFSSLLTTRAANLVPVPGGLAGSDIVFAEPLAVGVHAINRAGDIRDRRVLVIGAGPIGAILAAATVRSGAGQVTVTDLDPARLDLAAAMGVHETAQAGQDDVEAGYDVVFECSGSAKGIQSALELARKGGAVVLVGLPHGGPVAVPVGLGVSREIDLLGSFRFCHDEFVAAVDLLGDGLDLSPLHTDTYAAIEAPNAFETAIAPGSMKVQLDFRAAG